MGGGGEREYLMAVMLRGRRRSYTSNAASHDNHKKINLWPSFSFLCEYGASVPCDTSACYCISK